MVFALWSYKMKESGKSSQFGYLNQGILAFLQEKLMKVANYFASSFFY